MRPNVMTSAERRATSDEWIKIANRKLQIANSPALLADWLDVLFIHFEVDPAALAKEVPFELDLRDGKAYVSVVAFTQRNLRPAAGGALTRWLSRPVSDHPFLNIRTYVRVNGEAGIYFLSEWIPNRLATIVGPRLYGLPYRLGMPRYTIHRNCAIYHGDVRGSGVLRFTALAEAADARICHHGGLGEFLIERYVAFTRHGDACRRFRIEHEPWKVRDARVELHETSLLSKSGAWHATAGAVGAHFSSGLHDVRIGAPQRIAPLPTNRPRRRWEAVGTWGPLVALVGIALVAQAMLPAWGFMWAMCFALFFGCKWASFRDAENARGASLTRSMAYLLAWPGMDARAFLAPGRSVSRPPARQWARAAVNLAAGAGLMFFLAPTLLPRHPLGGGWAGMIGLVLIIHFGTFHLLALAWRSFGRVDAQPIMNAPIRARSVSEFWGDRWNLGFHDLAMRYLFRPIRAAGVGPAAALLATFIASGFLHELVITLPARGGYGLPTVYFTIQGLGILAERSMSFRRMFRRRPWLGRAFALIVVAAPVGLLFPTPFALRVVVPFLNAIGIG